MTDDEGEGRLITADQIRSAYATYVRAAVRRTPLFTSHSIAERAGCPGLFLKMENLQRTGSFKLRGATVKVAMLSPAERSAGIVAASAGNHAQGVALAARDAGIVATVFMPTAASIAKVQATEGYGARVMLGGENFDEAVAAAVTYARETGAIYVSAYDDDAIITGQGSLGVELLEDLPDIDTVLIPIGGGGLFAGVATAIRAERPACRIIGVQAAGADTAARSFRAGRLLPRGEPCDTIADGIAIKSPSPRTWAYIARYADDVVAVTDESIAQAILLLLTRAKIVAEPAGAAGVAALLEHPGIATGKTAVILGGGNIDLHLLSNLIERGMIRSHRYFHFFTAVRDKPGGLAGLLQAVAAEGGNVMQVTHDRLSPDVPYGQTGVEMLVEVRDEDHIAHLTAGLAKHAYRVRRLDV